MAYSSNIILSGDTLGERHLHLNRLVRETKDTGNAALIIKIHPENTVIDKIFKIDLAVKNKDVEYILNTLKDRDMLYVTRALKCDWLLYEEYSGIINPKNLEENLYGEMIKPAVNKIKHFIQIKLKVPERCEEFYKYYKSDFNESIKYMRHCSPEFIAEQVADIIEKLTPNHLEILCKLNPIVGKLYFDLLKANRDALARYLENEQKYFDSLKSILKSDGNSYLDLVECYFNVDNFQRLSVSSSKFIMQNYKERFMQKCEMYTLQILNINAVAQCLSSEECQELVLKLARSQYLEHWFSYQGVEPLIKRMKPDERSAFKKRVFVEKNVGDKITEWPYPKPMPLELSNDDDHVFKDVEQELYFDFECEDFCGRPMLRKRKFAGYSVAMKCGSGYAIRKTPLDILFDRYRFIGFTQAFNELTNRLQAESTIQGRQNIMLVLVSKSGGVIQRVETLLKLLVERHINEPSNLRAAIVRSLVKRVSCWRLPDNVWSLILNFGHGLGLDGVIGELLCVEGLHASLLHYITNGICPPKILMDSYKNNFSTFKDYKLNTSEISSIENHLLPLLLPDYPKEFVDLVTTYKMKVKTVPEADRILTEAARNNLELINKLYDSRIARRQLISLTFPIKQNEASYINALRHDVTLLDNGESFAKLVTKKTVNHDRFLSSLMIYFGETNGLAMKHLCALEKVANEKLKPSLARPLTKLSSDQMLLKKLQNLNVTNKETRRFAAALKSNAHNTSPSVNIDTVDWRFIGAKAVANQVLVCGRNAKENYIKSCLKLNTTAKLALKAALCSPLEVEAFKNIALIKPEVALMVALKCYFQKRDKMNVDVWDILKDLLLHLDTKKLSPKLQSKLCLPEKVPENIEANYFSTIYQSFKKTNKEKLFIILPNIEKHITDIDDDVVREIISDFIEKCTYKENDKDFTKPVISRYLRIIAKYLLLSRTADIQCYKIENVLHPLFDRMESVWTERESDILEYIKEFLQTLKYTKAFMDPQYVSVFPMFENLICRLQKVLPRVKHFETYVKIHLTMLYFKSIRHALSENNNLFRETNKTNAMKVVGFILGENIGSEIKELATEYFVSIIDVYKDGLCFFLNEYFPCNEGRKVFEMSLIKGILKKDYLEAHLLALFVLQSQCQPRYEHYSEVYEYLKQSNFQEVQFFINNEVY
ncbi:uncharacterized protein LOC126971226 [Leptidea sinapis]|uniref:uncharacterized protein LOC126971226 n=1 Tax=Leptidea sinapis TaxID=189913 RepID=UPI002123F286|nr:uncharacterized protein LOC126971226 [Leptidea sinapis]XP_050673362.1 uncharacterized protein LOC126971226 [Leptidea sinapis]XP_050673363.1 uncharacterized protein LOC126971226 [Leptidea sinapis]